MTERVGQRLGNYTLVRLLGRGSFADVYLGEHIHLKSFAAIKILYTQLTDDLHENFLHEARILAQLTHPHIVRLLDFGIEEGVPFLVMEYAPQGTLRQRHPHHSTLPLSVIIEYVKQIADGLQYAHEKKLIHRDLKPDNILIGQRDELLISDFGVALIARSTHSSSNAEQALAGTVIYMAPEQLKGHPQFASDQYALGVMAYEWLCGVRPFQGTVTELFTQHLYVPPTALRQHVPQLPPTIEQVILTALEKDPARRFANVKAFATALEQVAFPTSAAQSVLLPEISSFPSIPFHSPDSSSSSSSSSLSTLPTLLSAAPQPQMATPANTSASNRLPGFISERGLLRSRSAVRKAVPLLALVVLLILGTIFAATLYHTNAGNHEPTNKVVTSTPSPGTRSTQTIPASAHSGTASTGNKLPGTATSTTVATITPTTSSTGAANTPAPTPTPTVASTPTPTTASTTYAIDGKNPTTYKVSGQTCAATLSNSTPKSVSFNGVTGTLYFQFSVTCHAAWAKIVFARPVAASALGNAKVVRTGDGQTYTCDQGGNQAVAPGQTSCYTGMIYDGPSQSASAYGWYRSASGNSSWSARLGPY